MCPDKPGVMRARELTADDVVFTFNRLNTSPKKIEGMYDYVDKVEATDKHTVVFNLKEFNAEWDYRFGYGYYSAHLCRRKSSTPAPTNWKNINGTGPFQLTDYVAGQLQHLRRRTRTTGARRRSTRRSSSSRSSTSSSIASIKDEATRVTALRTGKLDMLESVRWQDVDSLKKSAPELKWNRWLEHERHVPGHARRHRSRSTTSACAAR